MKRGMLIALLLSLVGVGGIWSAHAATFTSPSFSINGNIGDSAAGAQSSTSYKLTSAAGESIAGNSSSKSYKLGQGYIPTLENSLQVVTQPNGLSAYWPLDDAAPLAPALDESQNLNNGIYSTDSGSVSGKVGTAWTDFNTTQSVEIPHSPSLPSGNKFTVSAWVNPDTVTATQRTIISKWAYNAITANNNGAWALQTSPAAGQLRMFISSGTGDDGINYADTTNASLTAGVWSHVVVVYDGTLAAADRVKFYINGSERATSTGGTIPTTLNATSTDPIFISQFPGLLRHWDGAIDELKLYSRSLNQPDITAEYSAGNAGLPAGVALGSITPGVSRTSSFDSIVQTSAGGYTLAINQNNNLTSGGNTIPGISGSIASPVSWSEGVTKGLGFTLYGTNATAIPGTWSSGAAYASLPGAATSFYTRTNYTGGTKDILNMRLRLDTQSTQVAGDYSNQMVITGTMIP